MTAKKQTHIPVLLKEFLSAFETKTLKLFIDGTIGMGGHSGALLAAHAELTHLIGFDQDAQACEHAKEVLKSVQSELTFIQRNFVTMQEELSAREVRGVDGILLDLGVSSLQLDEASRGFSFSKEAPLDMRMNRDEERTAADIVNFCSEQELASIFRDYGEEPRWRQAARTLVTERKKKRIETTGDLTELLFPVVFKKKKRHPLTLIFQGLRIAVNKELQVVSDTLPQAIELLNPGGLLAVITFHSLEDRIVKQYFQNQAATKIHAPEKPEGVIYQTPQIRLVNKKPIIATKEEIKENPRSRCAKMRIVEKLNLEE